MFHFEKLLCTNKKKKKRTGTHIDMHLTLPIALLHSSLLPAGGNMGGPIPRDLSKNQNDNLSGFRLQKLFLFQHHVFLALFFNRLFIHPSFRFGFISEPGKGPRDVPSGDGPFFPGSDRI